MQFVFTDYILFPYLVALTVWLVKSIMSIRENQIRQEEQLKRLLDKKKGMPCNCTNSFTVCVPNRPKKVDLSVCTSIIQGTFGNRTGT